MCAPYDETYFSKMSNTLMSTRIHTVLLLCAMYCNNVSGGLVIFSDCGDDVRDDGDNRKNKHFLQNPFLKHLQIELPNFSYEVKRSWKTTSSKCVDVSPLGTHNRHNIWDPPALYTNTNTILATL